MQGQDHSQTRPTAENGLDLILVLLLFFVALAVRIQYAKAVVFPPLDDPAFYLTSAESLFTEHKLEVDVLWSYRFPFDSVSHPSHEHWMPVTTFLIAGALAADEAVSEVVKTPVPAGQLPGLLLGALLAPLTYWIGRRVLWESAGSTQQLGRSSRWIALGAGLLVATNATLSYQSASADSSAPFALLTAWALSLGVRKPNEQGGYFGAGFLIALAYLTRADGLLLLIAIPLAWWLLPWPRRAPAELPDNPAARFVWEHWPLERGSEQDTQRALGPRLINALDLGIPVLLVIAPWLVRNYLVFGTPVPNSVLSQAWLTNYVDTFNYWHHPTWQTWLAQSWQTLLNQRFEALIHNGRVFLLTTFPWGLLSLPGFWLLRREWPTFPAIVYGVLLFFGVALVFPVSSMSGTFYHSLGALMPFLALAALYAIYRATQPSGRRRRLSRPLQIAVFVGLLVLTGFQVVQSLPTVAERHRVEKEQFEAITAWLGQNTAPDDVLMTTQTYTLNYVSGHPTIALPGNEPLDAAWEAAQRYGARYLVITQAFGQYPQILQETRDPRFVLLAEVEGTLIYAIGAPPP
jgi:4-amino-4-deoxy-L-arabinose transferase-like glycosyltransferase